MPRIGDDDDINLDEIDTEQPQDDQPEPTEDEPKGEDEAVEPPAPSDDQEEPVAAREEARGSRRIQTLANENRDLRKNLNDAIQRFDDYVRAQSSRQEPHETEIQRRERRDNMNAEERIQEDIKELRTELLGRNAQSDMRLTDQSDKTSFEMTWGNTQVAKKHAERIEQELVKMRKNGSNAPREVILAYLIGENAMLKFKANGGAQRKAAEARVRNATTRPANAGSDSTVARREPRRGNTLEDRLVGQPL